MQIALDTFIEKAKRTKFKYKAEIEESTIRGEEIKDARELFEQSIVIDAVDPITQRIPAEKFVWYMQDWLKNARLITEKLRLRNNSLKIQYNKLKALLTQKIELGESIHEVDFEQLRIENKHLIEKIEQKNTHLIELKKINGKANLNLATHKNYLQKILEGLKTIKNAIDESQLQTRIHEQETEEAKKELNEAITKYNDVKDLIDHYKVPEVFDYVKVKGRLYDLKKSLKILSRRINITKIILNTNTKKMMKLTREKRPLPNWFKEQDETDDYDDLYDEDDYIYSNPKDILSKDNRVSSEFDIFKALK
ncbi:PREDICTED: coiled-coil domain-containing protein 113 [Nicrophorus vespilloides]|uniref:Cilia- and flagella-associated protein 263 n=1 Tax=Nicrophorus vespilloides TaxID=110193 RepID=A0ABM1M6G3_NICVS|nr:PREDICTED: coiled-coil domain-containing protein 113 [Nicrophorus vespilloides]